MTRAGAYADEVESSEGNRRHLIFASIVLLVTTVLFSWQMDQLSAAVGQFTKYTVMARQVLAGTAQPERLLDFSPLYLGLHMAANRFWADPASVIRGMHVALLSFAATLLFAVLRRHFGVLLSFAGVTAFALGQSVMIYGYVFEPEPLMIFFLVSLFFFIEREGRPSALGAGLSFSLCLLTRPSFAPLLLVIPVYYLLRLPLRRMAGVYIGLFLTPVLLAGLFIGIRNYRLQGEFSLMFMSPGTVFFDGNNPLSPGAMAVYPPVVGDMTAQFPEEADYQHAVYRLLARTVTGRNLTPGEANRFWAGKAMHYIADYPKDFLLRTARRAWSVFHRYRWHDLFDAWSADNFLARKTGLVPFAPVSALAFIGLGFGLYSWRRFLFPCAVFLNQAALMTLTYTTDRQRVCLYPFFIFFAALAAKHFLKGSRATRIGFIGLIPVVILFSIESNLTRDERHNWEGYIRAGAFRAEADQAKAEREFSRAVLASARALALSPSLAAHGKPARLPVSPAQLALMAANELPSLRTDTPSTRLDRAILLIEAGQFGEAEDILRELQTRGLVFQRDDGRLSSPSYYLGRVAYLQGKSEQAAAFMRLALETSPGDPSVLAQLSCLTDDPRPAERIFRYFDDVDAVFYLGRACLETGRSDRAMAYLNQIGDYLPTYGRGQVYRAVALGANGLYQQASILYLASTGGRPDVVSYGDILIPVFERAARHPSPDSLYWFGVILREYGYFDEAVAPLQGAADAGHPGALKELRELQAIMGHM